MESTCIGTSILWRVYHLGWSKAIGVLEVPVDQGSTLLIAARAESSQASHRKTFCPIDKDLYLPSVALAVYLVCEWGFHPCIMCAHGAEK